MTIARSFWKIYLLFIKMENKRISKIIAFEKWLCISLYFFNDSKDNNHITTTLTCLVTNPRFLLKTFIFKNSKNLLHTLKFSWVFCPLWFLNKFDKMKRKGKRQEAILLLWFIIYNNIICLIKNAIAYF